MKDMKETGQPGLTRWLGVGVRLLVTLLFLLLLLALSRCGSPTQPATASPTGQAATARLRIEVQPSGATVLVDGLRSGTTPASLTLPPGEYALRVEQEGYEPLQQTIALTADRETVVDGELVPATASQAPTVTLIPTGASGAPVADLAIQQARVEMESGGDCADTSSPLGVRVWIENAGQAGAGPFVVEVNGARQAVDGLAAGQTVDLWFAGYTHDGENVVVVDAEGQVEESDKENNLFAGRLPVPTPPPTCTPPPAGQPPTGTPDAAPPTPTAPPPTSTPAPPQPQAAGVIMREGQVTIPTYPYDSFVGEAWSEAFNMPYPVLDRGAYEASGPAPSDATYRTFVVENEYLKLTFLPDVGGRLYSVVYKPTGHRVTYRNPVLKPSPWGPAEQGWWLAAGGFEWCLPVEEHGYEWGVPWKLAATADGQSVTVKLRDSTAEDRVRAEIAIRLEAGAAYFTIRPRLENPTGAPVAVKYWTNAMLAPGGQNAPSADLRFVLPEAVTGVTVHSRGDESLPAYGERMSWPVANGVDLSRLGNWNRWLGFFEDPAAGEFVAVYDEGYDEGMVRVYPAEAAPGTKIFAFGWQDPIAPGNWTDDGSGYVEIHGGAAPTFDASASIPAGGQLQWTETWYPVAGLGGLRYANNTAALNLEAGGGQAQVAVAAPRAWSGDLVLLLGGQELWRQSVSLSPGQPQQYAIPLGAGAPETARLALRLETAEGDVAAEYSARLRLK